MAVSASVETANSLAPLPGWLYQRVASTAASKNPAGVRVKGMDLVRSVLLARLVLEVVVQLVMENSDVEEVLHLQQPQPPLQPDLVRDAETAH